MNHLFVDKADRNLPQLFHQESTTDKTVSIVSDENAFFGCRTEATGTAAGVYRSGDRFTLDFGEHCVGYLSFRFRHHHSYLDAPVRLRLRFAEIPYELWRSFDSYHGILCASWLQEEIITLDDPDLVQLRRRYAFRYLEVKVLASPGELILSGFSVQTVTSADWSRLRPLPAGTDEDLVRIDAVAAKTLADCMQSAYEDGPKRDRRLWSGDLRLQALTDYYLFKNDALARRCLYLFAACEEEGKYLPGCLYQKPAVFYGDGDRLTDYALIFTVSLCDYFEHTRDEATARELFPTAQRQIDHALSLLDENGIITFPGGWSRFIDWASGLQHTTACQGVLLYALERMAALAGALGQAETASRWQQCLARGREAAKKHLFDGEKGYFCNAYDNYQRSVHAQVWMILGGVVTGQAGVHALKALLHNPDALQPVAPYMYHYVLEAMVKLGLMEDALALMKSYWGGMVAQGADTFWEIYVPTDNSVSSADDAMINSFCHAWSCSPSYFIRKYFVDWSTVQV